VRHTRSRHEKWGCSDRMDRAADPASGL